MNLPLIQLWSTITCPVCGFQKEEKMPQDSCQYFYECTHCISLIKPQKDDCCVYCSYGSIPCPPIQKSTDSSCCH
ncbi:hypothetical protein KFE94_05340 [bacterium SCSIO 12643]|nr:hypothetical protein KFE94_05340 [bacterium SCSIO 12643]